MENKKKHVGGGSSSSSMSNLDHLFGPKDSSSASHSSSTGLFDSIFPPPSTVLGRDKRRDYGSTRHAGNDNMSNKRESSGSKDSMYQSETGEPCYFSSSIYYGGQGNYSPTTKTTDNHSHQPFKKDEKDDDPNSNETSRGNWWKGSLYY